MYSLTREPAVLVQGARPGRLGAHGRPRHIRPLLPLPADSGMSSLTELIHFTNVRSQNDYTKKTVPLL